MKATEQYFPMMQSIILYIVGVTFESVNENVKGDYTDKSYRGIFPYDAVHHVVHCGCDV